MTHPLKGDSERDKLRDASRGERLQRVMADAGVASRRACEELIREGHVKVNGRTVTDLPVWVDPAEDHIVVKGRPLQPVAGPVYVMLNKPTRTLCAASDEPGADRLTVIDLVQHYSKARLFPVGRLDYDTTGLLILTNDGDLAHKLTHPRFGGLRVYEAIVAGIVKQDELNELNRRLSRSRKADAIVPIEMIDVDDGRSVLRITLQESRGKSVQDLLAKLGHHVKKLERIGFGPLKLSGVPVGQWRDLEKREVIALKRSTKPGANATLLLEAPRLKSSRDKGKKRAPGTRRSPNASGPSRRRTGSAPAARPAGRPTGKPAGTSASTPGRPTTRPTGNPAARPTGKPSGRPLGKPSAKPNAKPSAKPGAKPAGKPSGKPGGRPTSQPGGKPGGKPGSRPGSRPSAGPQNRSKGSFGANRKRP